MNEALPIPLILHCPYCGEQHIDKPTPDICANCGTQEIDHFMLSKENCVSFEPWRNPPHKSHRCIACNFVWRPADCYTVVVATTNTKGTRDQATYARTPLALRLLSWQQAANLCMSKEQYRDTEDAIESLHSLKTG